jgi:dsRNA-specific ribonuclease
MIRFNFLLQNLRLNLILIFLFMPCLKGWCSEFQTSEIIDTASGMTRYLSPYNEFCSNISYNFKNPNLLELAVTHNLEDLGTTLSLRGNERLEFLGDSVLEFCLRLVLWKKAPIPFREHLTTTCSSLAANITLANICDHIGLDKLASFPPTSVLHKKNPKRDSLLDAKADRLEALIGAMYLDGENIETIFSFIGRYWFSDAAPQNFTSLFNSSQEQATKEQEDLGYQFKDSCLLQCALGDKVPLNFLGRGLLKFIIAKFLYNRFPDFPEGELSKRAAVLLAKKATPDFSAFKRMIGSTLDASAIVGGMYLDSDLETTTNFILWHWTNPNSSIDIKIALQKELYFSTSKTAIIYPPAIRTDTPSKSLLLALLSSIDQVPVFTTEGGGESTSTGFRSSVSFCSALAINLKFWLT